MLQLGWMQSRYTIIDDFLPVGLKIYTANSHSMTALVPYFPIILI